MGSVRQSSNLRRGVLRREGLRRGTLRRGIGASLCALGLVAAGCSNNAAATTDSAAPASSSAEWLGIPKPYADVQKVINRSGRQPYSGPTGTVRGRVTISGDPAPSVEWKYPPDCGVQALETYGKAFRASADGGLADALVTVTGYDAFVPPAGPAVKVTATRCSFDRRTIAMTYGQRLEVTNIDEKGAFMPYLDDGDYRALILAMPGGAPVKLYPLKPGRRVLRDFQGRDFLQADVYVLAYPTTGITDTDGMYTISGVPVGQQVTVTAFLPDLDKVVEQKIEVKEGENVVDLKLTFDAKVDKILPRPPGPFERPQSDVPARKAGEFGGPPLQLDDPSAAPAGSSQPAPPIIH